MIRLTIALMSVFLLLISCSQLKEPLASVSHEDGWLEPTSEIFHADKVEVSGALSCRACHGTEVDSGKDGTFCVNCHKNYPDVSYPHNEKWLSFETASSHGAFIKTHANSLTCNNCHNSSNPQAPGCDNCH